MLLAAGAVAIKAALYRPIGRWFKPAIVVVLTACGVYFAPIFVPILSPDHFISYMKRLPFKLPAMEHAHARVILPPWYAGQFGWNEIVAETAIAWNQLSPDERRDCGIFAQDYGQAGAIDFLGRKIRPAVRTKRTSDLVFVGAARIFRELPDDRRERLEKLFSDVRFVGTSADNCYALERQIPVFICRGPKLELSLIFGQV